MDWEKILLESALVAVFVILGVAGVAFAASEPSWMKRIMEKLEALRLDKEHSSRREEHRELSKKQAELSIDLTRLLEICSATQSDAKTAAESIYKIKLQQKFRHTELRELLERIDLQIRTLKGENEKLSCRVQALENKRDLGL